MELEARDRIWGLHGFWKRVSLCLLLQAGCGEAAGTHPSLKTVNPAFSALVRQAGRPGSWGP